MLCECHWEIPASSGAPTLILNRIFYPGLWKMSQKIFFGVGKCRHPWEWVGLICNNTLTMTPCLLYAYLWNLLAESSEIISQEQMRLKSLQGKRIRKRAFHLLYWYALFVKAGVANICEASGWDCYIGGRALVLNSSMADRKLVSPDFPIMEMQ